MRVRSILYVYILMSIVNVCMYVYNHCIVDGGWSSWTCGPCSKTCGGGKKSCSRRCNNPIPSCGGNGCPGSRTEERSCIIDSSGKDQNLTSLRI